MSLENKIYVRAVNNRYDVANDYLRYSEDNTISSINPQSMTKQIEDISKSINFIQESISQILSKNSDSASWFIDTDSKSEYFIDSLTQSEPLSEDNDNFFLSSKSGNKYSFKFIAHKNYLIHFYTTLSTDVMTCYIPISDTSNSGKNVMFKGLSQYENMDIRIGENSTLEFDISSTQIKNTKFRATPITPHIDCEGEGDYEYILKSNTNLVELVNFLNDHSDSIYCKWYCAQYRRPSGTSQMDPCFKYSEQGDTLNDIYNGVTENDNENEVFSGGYPNKCGFLMIISSDTYDIKLSVPDRIDYTTNDLKCYILSGDAQKTVFTENTNAYGTTLSSFTINTGESSKSQYDGFGSITNSIAGYMDKWPVNRMWTMCSYIDKNNIIYLYQIGGSKTSIRKFNENAFFNIELRKENDNIES